MEVSFHTTEVIICQKKLAYTVLRQQRLVISPPVSLSKGSNITRLGSTAIHLRGLIEN
jgi:hypothetical protein